MERTNTLPIWIGAIALIVLVGGYFYFAGNTNTASGEQGKVYVTVSDAAAEMSGVQDVSMTVDKVELRSASGGWVTVSSAPHTFNLLTLKANGKAELAGSANVAAGTYDQLRISVRSVEVKTKSAGNKAAVVVARTMAIPGTIVVRAEESTHADIDVQTSSSLFTASSGEYVFAPVIVYQTSHGSDVSVASDNSVTASGGTTDTNTAVGTDLSGNIVVGSQLSPNVVITVSGGTARMESATSTGSGSGLIQINTLLLMSGNASGSAGGNATSSRSGAATSSTQVRGSGSGSVQVNY